MTGPITVILLSLRGNLPDPHCSQVVPRLLGSLVGGSMSPTQHLEQQQALVKQFAEILEFVLKFDEYKVSISKLFSPLLHRGPPLSVL